MKIKVQFLILAFLIFSSFSFAKNSVPLSEALWISDPDKVFLDHLSGNFEFVVDHTSQEGYELYGPSGTSEYLKRLGVSFFNQADLGKNKSQYPSYEQITESLKKIVSLYPDIMSMESIGTSVEGRELWVVKVSDNVLVDEVEPEFKYISSMHGDEIVGRELMILFLEDIGKNYYLDPEVKNLVDNTEIFIMPSMNPDGSEMAKRWNARGVDLNRNFPDIFSNRNTNADREPETKAVMNFQKKRNFSLSANFHGGAVVVNYPWDSTYTLHPQDDLIKNFSLEYASFNGPMRDSSEFPGGVINGAKWYVVRGGMQDWSSHFYNDLQVTVELSDIKWPDYEEIDDFYQDNRASLYHYILKIHQGAGFEFKSNTLAGSVKITKIDKDVTSTIGTFSFKRGQFYKVLDKGRYILEIKAPNYSTVLEVGVTGDLIENGPFVFINK